jgi:membrane-bound lytic murein transglycosylase B
MTSLLGNRRDYSCRFRQSSVSISATAFIFLLCPLLVFLFSEQAIAQDTTPPLVVSTTPANGATNVSVSLAGASITFSEPMNGSCSYTTDFEIWGAPPTGPSWSADKRTVSFLRDPAVPLPVGVTIQFTISNLHDVAGNPLSPSPYILSFLVGTSADLPPAVTSTNPINGATGVSRDLQTIAITFSEPMNPGAISIATNIPGFPNSWSTSWSDYHRVLHLTRTDTSTRFPGGATYSFVLNGQGYENFRDTQGNFLPETTLSFTIVEEFDYELSKIPESPGKGFSWPYYLLIPNTLSPRTILLVEPNNTGFPTDDLSVHDTKAHDLIIYRSNFAIDLDVPLLIPIFPRPYTNGHIYTHALDRYSLTENVSIQGHSLQRIDLQLIAMIRDAQERLRSLGFLIDEKILMHGFSASGAFTSRFTLLHPEIVKAAAPGSPGGWPIAPVSSWLIPSYGATTLRYPVGIADVETLTGAPVDLATYRTVPQYIYVGDIDQNDALDLRNFPSNEETAICSLLTCGNAWIADRWPIAEQMYDSANANGQFVVYPRVDHTITDQMFSDVHSFFSRHKFSHTPTAVDFDGDKKSDVLWFHSVSGTVAIWLMNGATISSLGVPGVIPSDWQIRGIGDFNGEGKSDILWQHPASGTVAVWIMNGKTVSSVGIPGVIPSDWQIRGIGDFDGDGKSDILWQHPASGTVAVWIMNGPAISSVGVTGVIPSDWQIRGIGDFDGDGKSDILWQHPASGTVAVWIMNGPAISSVGIPGVIPSDWQIRGIGDFNGDGKSDILWQHPASGTVAVWIMNGKTVSSVGIPGVIPSDWQIRGVGDFNGDGKSDILWQHSASGTVAVWIMNGPAISSVGVPGVIPSDWQIMN